MAKIDYNTYSWNKIEFGMGTFDWIKSPKEIF
jgi:hypothetical protein